MIPTDEELIVHEGMEKRSGRYPWGSGAHPFQRSGDLLSRVEELSKDGISKTELAKSLEIGTTDLDIQLKVAKHERRQLQADKAKALRDDGKSLNEIASIMGFKNDSSVRSLLDENTASNKNKAHVTASKLKAELEEKGDMLDVGATVERQLGVSANTLKEALFLLKLDGYNVYKMGIPQVNAVGKQSNTVVLAKEHVPYKDVYQRMGDIAMVGNYHSTDGGTTFTSLKYPTSVDSSRVHIRYGDKGGTNKDGVIELRRGVADLDLENSHYAQVRVLVDGSHYLKGMAVYSDDIPEGTDIVFNTNKKSGTPKGDVFKKIKEDPTNPFGSYIKANGQHTYIDKDGKEQLSAINKLKEEGDWDKMAENLSSQFLSKQPLKLINKQLNLTYAEQQVKFDDIMKLTNPTLKKKMLLDFAGKCDSSAIHLKAAALPRQKSQVLLPLSGISDKEIYAPNFNNGEKVCLVRYPHGGIFEIPELTVNNKNKSGIANLGPNIMDAVGVHPNTAEKLSGADFDGDHVVVIPTNSRVQIKSKPSLSGLVGFNAKDEYAPLTEPNLYIPKGPNDKTPLYEGKKITSKLLSKGNVGREMGMISNLITDMTLKGASDAKITRAVKHSMVVIDAEKHKLDYTKSEKENRILELKREYQGYVDITGKDKGGASTLLSRRKHTVDVPERRGSGRIDPETGKVTYNTSGREYAELKKNKLTGETLPTGTIIKATTKENVMLYVDDTNALSSGTLKEKPYADYANKMKAMGNEARKAYKATGNLEVSKEAKKLYAKEVDDLNARLNVAMMNAYKERHAHAQAQSVIKAKVLANPDLKKDKKELKKVGQQAIYDARNVAGAHGKENKIVFSDREWEAIQAGAITDTKLTQILKYADGDSVLERAMPKTANTLSPIMVNKIKAMQQSGYTNIEIANALGKSTNTVFKYLNQGKE